MALRRHNIQWLGVYREDTKAYVGGSDIRVGGSQGYNSYLGFNSAAILADIQSSKVRARVHLRFTVTDAGTFDLGMHKEASNKASAGLPYYAWSGRSFTPDTGARGYDITDFPVSVAGHRSFEAALKGGFHGPVLYGQRNANYGVATGAYIEIEGVWNEPPTKPKLLFPVGGETLSGTTLFRTGPSTDPDGNALTYQFSLKDGRTTHFFPRQSSLTLTVDLSKYTESSTAVVGVRAYDGESYSGWAYSKVFTLRHNIAPTQPNLSEPVGGVSRDRTKTIRFVWVHNDQDPQSLFRFRWRLQGGANWNTLQVVSTGEVYAVPANTFPYGTIEWQIQTEDQGGLKSPWSASALFLAAEQSDAPTILSPAMGAVIPSEDLAISWSSSGQVQYEVELSEGSSILWSVSRASGNKAVSAGVPLVNNVNYRVRVRIRDAGGLWSDWAEASFSTSFTPPPQPELSITPDKESASIYVAIHNPLPAGDEPDVLHNELYRREPNREWVRIARYIPPESGFTDFTPAGNIVYEYYAKAMGENDTTMDSSPVIGMVEVNHVWIQATSDPTFAVPLAFNLGSAPQRSFSYSIEAMQMQFSGRRLPVTEYGEFSAQGITTDYTVKTANMWKLIELIERRETLLYRDSKGRKAYVSAVSLQVGDKIHDNHTISLPLNETDYQEGV